MLAFVVGFIPMDIAGEYLMIQQIQLVLSPPNDVRIPQSWSYRLYGWLMSQISSEFGEQMHLQGEHPIAHFLCFSPEKQSLIWTVNLLNDAARQVVFPFWNLQRKSLCMN